MDWYLDRDGLLSTGTSGLRHQIREYLVRHGEPGTETMDAELIVAELLNNAVEHASGPVWVRLSWAGQHPDIEVWDLGPGFTLDTPDAASYDVTPDLSSEGGRGLFIVSHLASAFEVGARRGGGTRVVAQLPVRRAPARSTPHTTAPGTSSSPLLAQALPGLDEAAPDGSFGKESFLRALVVQLSQAVEFTAGPDVGEDVVTQVGLAVGGQMEAAYRASRRLTERLTPEQLADCFVRLKHAIDGDFSVVEITEDRIVLDNTRCPFGDVVRKSPALCRMTSSVFGGITARNAPDGAAVVLEERIAVGDPRCRVVVHLGPAPQSSARFAHRYAPPGAEPGSEAGPGTGAGSEPGSRAGSGHGADGQRLDLPT